MIIYGIVGSIWALLTMFAASGRRQLTVEDLGDLPPDTSAETVDKVLRFLNGSFTTFAVGATRLIAWPVLMPWDLYNFIQGWRRAAARRRS
jgi:hypothetical protein